MLLDTHRKPERFFKVIVGYALMTDAESRAALQTIVGHSDSVNTVTFLPDGKQVVSASNDRIVKLWDSAM
jgi:WD40 repeat protein